MATTVSLDDIRVNQTPGSIDCAGHLLVADLPLTDQTDLYDAQSSGKVSIGYDWSNFFKTTDATNCPASSCALYDSSCQTPLASSSENNKDNIIMTSTSPWQLSALNNVAAGYDVSVCIKCEAPDST